MEDCMLCGFAKELVDGYMCAECYNMVVARTAEKLFQELWDKVKTHDDIDCGCYHSTHYRLMVAYNDGKARVIKICNSCGRAYR
jgi:hypothetical protein